MKEPKYIIEFRNHCEKFWYGKNMRYVQMIKAILAYYQHVLIEAILITQRKINPKEKL